MSVTIVRPIGVSVISLLCLNCAASEFLAFIVVLLNRCPGDALPPPFSSSPLTKSVILALCRCTEKEVGERHDVLCDARARLPKLRRGPPLRQQLLASYATRRPSEFVCQLGAVLQRNLEETFALPYYQTR